MDFFTDLMGLILADCMYSDCPDIFERLYTVGREEDNC